jgi:glyoxylate reductase
VSGALDGVLVIYRTFESVETTGRFDKELVALLPASVKFICHNGMSNRLFSQSDRLVSDGYERRLTLALVGAGYDQIDVEACTNRNISVSHAPNAVNDSTADTAIFLMLGALRRFNPPMATLRAGNWRGQSLPPLGHNPQGKTLGILGMGRIGRNLKAKAEVFGMKVMYHNRNKLSEELAMGAFYTTFDNLLRSSDVLSVNLPLNVSVDKTQSRYSCCLSLILVS